MGWQDWIWSSKPTSGAPPSPLSPNVPPSQSSSTTQSISSPSTPSIPQQPTKQETPLPKPLSRDERAEAEWRDLLRELDAPPASLNHSDPDSPLPRHADPSQLPSSLSGAANPEKRRLSPKSDPDGIHPTSLLPTEMSCRAAFDAAFYCQSMGGQFVNLYRYGGVRNCSEMWSNFWFCMRTNRGGFEDEERVERIRQHYWERMEKYRTGPSSEDVWEVRLKKIDRPFEGDYDADERKWRQEEERLSGKREA